MAKRSGPKRGAGLTQTEELYGSRTEDTLSESAKIYRDAFCREYIKDFVGANAMARIGVADIKRARVRASQLLREPYVANRIDALIRQLQPEDIVTRGQVMAKMWELANTAFLCSSRVAATAHVAKMLGMDRQKEEVSTAPIGVMMIPCTSPEDWATAAATAQALLKKQATGG